MCCAARKPLAIHAHGCYGLSGISSGLHIVADTEPQTEDARTDQTTLIRLLQVPQAQSFYFTRAGVDYYRLSEPILSAADARGQTTTFGAVSIDMRLSSAETEV